MCKPGSERGRGGQPTRSTRPITPTRGRPHAPAYVVSQSGGRISTTARHIGQLSMAQVIVFQELKSFLRISIRTWLMDQNPCETSHFLAIGVLTQRCSISGQPRLGCLHASGRLVANFRRGRSRQLGRDISRGRERRANPAGPLGLNLRAQTRLANSDRLPLRSRRGHERRAE